MENNFSVSYVTTLPKNGNAPRLTIIGNDVQTYHVSFGIYNGELLSSGHCKTNETIICGVRQWYTDWFIIVKDEENQIVFQDKFNLTDKPVFIKMDAYALGDTIAWIPYVEEFRKRHRCNVICSTFHNKLLIDSYPNILFVAPNTVIDNVYTQYYIGAANDGNLRYSPIVIDEHPLQMAATSILGLPFKELRPDLSNLCNNLPKPFDKKYVTLSEFGSHTEKNWKFENGWQLVVDFLKEKGYEVLIISKEKTTLNGVIDISGDTDLKNIANIIKNSDFHMGVSSGLSWLAWGLDTHVVMISDVTPNFHEFNEGITRFNINDLTRIDYSNTNTTNVDEVIKKIGELIE